MKKKIFITGISSLIIEKLCCNIDFSKYEVIGLSRQPKKQTNKNIKIIKGDINTINTFSNVLNDCDIVIHAAAVTHAYNPKHYYKTNFEATKQIVDICTTKPFVFISSNTAHEKNGAYGHSKILAENYIKNHCEHWQIIRLSEVFGMFQEGIDQFINTLIHKPLALCPTGVPYKFSPIHIDDVAILLQQYIFNDDFNNQIININGEKLSFNEIITLVNKHRKTRVIYIHKKIMYLILNITKIIPFSIGIIPDQIERLYGVKSYKKHSFNNNLMSLNEYLTTLINQKS